MRTFIDAFQSQIPKISMVEANLDAKKRRRKGGFAAALFLPKTHCFDAQTYLSGALAVVQTVSDYHKDPKD